MTERSIHGDAGVGEVGGPKGTDMQASRFWVLLDQPLTQPSVVDAQKAIKALERLRIQANQPGGDLCASIRRVCGPLRRAMASSQGTSAGNHPPSDRLARTSPSSSTVPVGTKPSAA